MKLSTKQACHSYGFQTEETKGRTDFLKIMLLNYSSAQTLAFLSKMNWWLALDITLHHITALLEEPHVYVNIVPLTPERLETQQDLQEPN